MLQDAYEQAHIMTKSQTVNEYGGTDDTWTQGHAFKAFFTMKNGSEIAVANRDSVKSAWVILCDLNVGLRQNDVVKRDSCGTMYRITGVTRRIPAVSEMKFARFDAEVIE